jgi:hypothetical protein
MIIITMLTFFNNAKEVFHQQGLNMNPQATMDNQRKHAIPEMKTISGNSIGDRSIRSTLCIHLTRTCIVILI